MLLMTVPDLFPHESSLSSGLKRKKVKHHYFNWMIAEHYESDRETKAKGLGQAEY